MKEALHSGCSSILPSEADPYRPSPPYRCEHDRGLTSPPPYCLQVNLIFVGMIGSSFFALKEVGVGMVTVWKNLSNFVTAVGDVVIYKKSYTLGVW